MYKKFFLHIMLSFFCFFTLCQSMEVSAEERKKVKVGMTEFNYLSEVDEEGNREGIIYDYLAEISKYANWDMEFVDVGMQEAVDKLTTGELDVVGGLSRNEATEEIFDFPETNMGYIYTCIITKNNRTEYIPHDYDTLDGMKIGVLSKAKMRIAELETFQINNNLSFDVVYYDNEKEFFGALDRREVDGVIVVNTSKQDTEKIVARFAPNPFYFGTTKGKSDIVRDINKAMEMVAVFAPDLDTEIYRKYFENPLEGTEFSNEEKQFIAKEQKIKVGCVTDWKPYIYYDEKAGVYQGITIDVLEKVSDTTGLDFEYVGVESLDKAVKMVQNGELDMICDAYSQEMMKEQTNIIFSIPYLNTQVVTVTRKDEDSNLQHLADKTAAITQGFEKIYDYEAKEAEHYKTITEAMEAVKKKQVDFSIVSFWSAETFKRNIGGTNLAVTPILNSNIDFSFAYNMETPSELISVIDKTILAIKDSDMQTIILNNTLSDGPISFTSFLYSNPTQVIFGIVILAVLAMAAIFAIMRLRLKYAKQEAVLGETYRMIGEIANEYLFEYDCITGKLKLPAQLCDKMQIPNLLTEGVKAGGMELLYEHLANNKGQESTSLDIECHLQDGKTEWYRATCALLSDAENQPIKNIGKISSIQSEYSEKRLLEIRANSDGLTGLYIKTYCEKLVNERLGQEGFSQKVALIMIDLDHFKTVNDTLGHLGGDAVLKFLASIICDMPGDIISARFGGDEFVLFIGRVGKVEDLKKDLNRLCKRLNQVFTFGENSVQISISIGGVVCNGNGQTFNGLLEVADQALYETKNRGRNNYTLIER